ncbi:hypothetical protein L1887_28068 [Cichorium endivia]|nr:hypothetical protein L1887_28068 [Cichorium endivia]
MATSGYRKSDCSTFVVRRLREGGFQFSDSLTTVTSPCKREGFLQGIKDEQGEGCNIYGFLDVNKVAGNFHFAPGKSFQQSNMHFHDLKAFQRDSFNVL